MRTAILALLAACLSLAVHAANPSQSNGLDARVAEQNALLEDYYQSDLRTHPERATAYGDYRYNDRLDDRSLAGLSAEHTSDRNFLAHLRAISTTDFSGQDAMSHELLLRTLQQHIDDYDLKEYEMPVSQMDGPHVDLADLPLSVPFATGKQYEDYIARLHQIPRAFAQTEEVLRSGIRDKLMPVRFLLEKVPAQCEGIISADPFLAPTRKYPSTISAGDQQRLTREIARVVASEVLPAYRAFGNFMATQYAPHGRTTLAVTSLPGGQQRYLNDIRRRTTVSTLTPDQIYQVGVREMNRIEAEMLVIARDEGFADIAAYRASLKSNPKYRPTSAEQILDDFRKYIAQMQPKLPELFGFVPDSPITVEAIPEFQAAMATHYQTGTPDGKRPGRVVVATSNFADRSLTGDEAIAYHEGIPGHHMQLSVAQLITGLPKSFEVTSSTISTAVTNKPMTTVVTLARSAQRMNAAFRRPECQKYCSCSERDSRSLGIHSSPGSACLRICRCAASVPPRIGTPREPPRRPANRRPGSGTSLLVAARPESGLEA
jgi:uncharacterized protein (DUF885 family)